MRSDCFRLGALFLLLALGSGCAQPGLYHWNDYEDKLYRLYKSPEAERDFHTHLREMIDEDRAKGRRIPPGVAAEYGFMQYKAGRIESAIEYFELERRMWPESSVLMTRLIERVQSMPTDGDPAENEGPSTANIVDELDKASAPAEGSR